jgi:undecaprenol kinase
MPSSKNRSFAARLHSSLAGLVAAIRSERSLRTQLGAAAAVTAAMVFLRPEPLWWGLVGMATFAVLAAELFNTALEHLADHLHPAEHAQIRIVKDCAAAAVLVTSCGAIAVAVALGVHLINRAR